MQREPGSKGPTAHRHPRRWSRLVLGALLLIGGPAVALGVPDTVRIPPVKQRAATDLEPAVFSHWQHSTYTCASCHPSTFPQRKLGFTHAEMEQGRFCGSCHDGETAFAPKAKGVDCETCHVPTRKRDINEDELWD